MYNKALEELEKEYAKELDRQSKEIKENPLSQYSTSQLKAELRRRKHE